MIEKYIQIKDNLVVNILLLNPETDNMDAEHVWIPLGNNVCTDGSNIQVNTTTYVNNSFISNIPQITLQEAKAKKLSDFVTEILNFVNSRYDLEKRVNYLGIYNNAINKGLTNRAAYFQALLDWQNDVYTYSAYVQYSITILTTVQDVLNFTWDFTQLQNDDPLTTYGGAFSITD